MSDTCVDSCCLINLINGDVAEAVGGASGRQLMIQGFVEDEVQGHHAIIDKLVEENYLILIDGSTVFASEVGLIADTYNIGLGEAECIAIAKKRKCYLASDDNKARKAGIAEVGNSNVIGSIGLLRELVAQGVITAREAWTSYRLMKDAGAFLPKLSSNFFY